MWPLSGALRCLDRAPVPPRSRRQSHHLPTWPIALLQAFRFADLGRADLCAARVVQPARCSHLADLKTTSGDAALLPYIGTFLYLLALYRTVDVTA